MNDLIIDGFTIKQDSNNRFCLNDLHKAAGAEKRHAPNYWLAIQQTKELIEELIQCTTDITVVEQIQPVVTINGGNNRGTFVVKELVYAYSAWISPKFYLRIIRSYDSLVNDAAQYDLALTQWKKAMLLEKPCEWQKLYTEDFYKPIMRLFGWQFESNKGGLPSVIGLITRNWIYDVVVPPEILAEIDEKRESEKIHQWFNDLGGREKLRHQIAMVSGIAKTCRTYGEFKIKAGCVFNDTPLQIEML
jgi:hypothetical protein